jgi:multiple sugar transport system substrate-binding protein
MKKNKWFTSVVASALIMSVVSGCGSNESAKPAGDSAAGKSGGSDETGGKVVELVFERPKDVTQASQKMIQAFEAKHKDIKIKLLEVPASTDKVHDDLVTKFTSGDNSVDVFGMDIVWTAEFGVSGWSLPLNDYFKDSELSALLPGPVAGNKYKDKLYAIPFYTDAGVLFYRKDILEEAKVTPPKTFDELMKLSKELKGKGGTEYGYVSHLNQFEGLNCVADEFFWGNGGTILDKDNQVQIDSANNKEALQYLVDLVNNGSTPQGATTYVTDDARIVFTEGKSVFMRNWPSAWAKAQEAGSKVKDKVGIVPVPYGPKGKESSAALGGWDIGINANIDKSKVNAAVTFLKFIISEEAQKINAIDGGRLPVLQSTYKDQDVLKANPYFADLYPAFISAKPRPVSPIYPQLADVMQIEIHKAITKKQPVDDALKNMQSQMTDLYKKFNK